MREGVEVEEAEARVLGVDLSGFGPSFLSYVGVLVTER